MARSVDETLSDENGFKPYIDKCLNLLKLLIRYILIILCLIFKFSLFKFVSLFDYWLDKLYSAKTDEDIHVEQFKTLSSNSNIQNNEETNKIEVIGIYNEEALQHNLSHQVTEEVEQKNKSQVHDTADIQSSNQEVVEKNVEQILSQSLINKEIDIQSDVNHEDIEENLEQLMLSPTDDEEIDCQSVNYKNEKRFLARRNTAIFLFSKTMKEIKGHSLSMIDLEEEKLNKMKFDANIDLSCETPIFENGNSRQENEMSAIASNSSNEEFQFIQQKSVQNDSSTPGNNSHDNTALSQSSLKSTNDQCEQKILTNNDSIDDHQNKKIILRSEKSESDDTQDILGHHDSDGRHKTPILVKEKFDSDDNKNNRSFGRQNKTPILVYEKMSTVIRNVDAFDLPKEFCLALTVTEDLQFSMGTAIYFKAKYGSIGKLMDQNLRLGDIGEILLNGQYIFYLVTRERYKKMPALSFVERTLVKLGTRMKTLKLTKLAIPKSGFDRCNDNEIMILTSKIFGKLNIEVIMCMIPSKLNIPIHNNCKVNFTKKQLWEMEPQTDIVIFVNMDQMYLDDWKDKVVEHVNYRYPFKHRLLEDINLKPVAAGDILSYKIKNEELFCIFTKPYYQNAVYFDCLEKALQIMKSQMTGYRYLAFQGEYINDPKTKSGIPRHLLLLQTVFSNSKAEIWICNDDDLLKIKQMEHYNNSVSSTTDKNDKIVKTNTKTKTHRSERKKNKDYVTKMHGFVEPTANNKYYGNKTVTKN